MNGKKQETASLGLVVNGREGLRPRVRKMVEATMNRKERHGPGDARPPENEAAEAPGGEEAYCGPRLRLVRSRMDRG